MKKWNNRRLSIILAISTLLLTIMPNAFNTAHAITNGELDGENHPYVCLVVVDFWNGTHHVPAYRGTGILISPTIVLTAGHLTYDASQARVWFDSSLETNEEYPGPGSTSTEGTPRTHPNYVGSGGPGLNDYNWVDVGLVELVEPVEMDEYGVLPDIGEVDALRPMTMVDQIGYGVQERVVGGGPVSWTGTLERYYAPAAIIKSKDVLMDDFIKTTANPGKGKGGTAFGDSGGPVLLEGTNIIVGLTSWGWNYNCAGISYAARVDTFLVQTWINSYIS
jgi:hypothetical protein